VCLHGEPSWGYLYRTMIPVLAAEGRRVVVPDLVGFGRSDKPAERSDYTYERHVAWMTGWLVANDLTGLTLVGQDWGGLIGLRLVAEQPDRFSRVVVANTFLPTGDRAPSEAFLRWQKYSQESPRFHVGGIVSGGCVTRPLPDSVIAAYDAPFPDDSYMAGARQFPALVPTSPADPAVPANLAAWRVLERWDKPMLTAFSDSDPITAGADRVFQARVPGCRGQAHTTIVGAGHFLQEDQGPALAAVVNDFIGANPA
jgi:haloalkane dehalogenase